MSKKVSHLRFTKDIEGKGRPLKKHLGNNRQLSSAELAAPIEKQVQSPSASLPVTPGINGESRQGRLSVDSNGTDGSSLGAAGGLSKPAEDWGGDLMDVHDDDGDWSECLSSPESVADRLLIARLPISRQTNSRRERSGTRPISKLILWLLDSRRPPEEEDDRDLLREEAVLAAVAAVRCASELQARTLRCGCRWTWTLLTAGTSTSRTQRLPRRRRNRYREELLWDLRVRDPWLGQRGSRS